MIHLEAFELIKQVKYRYFRALDTKNWALLSACLTNDSIARYDDGKYSFDGREQIVSFLKHALNSTSKITLHQGHHPELDLEDDNNAKGIWYLRNIVIDLDRNTTLRGAGFYNDKYQKIDGNWLISSTGYSSTFEEIERRSDHIKIIS